MKNILRDKLGRFKSFKINLLDGQRRGEVIFRRVFLLVVLYTILLLIGKLVVPKNPEVLEVEGSSAVVEWVGGDRVTTYSDGLVEVVPKEAFMDKQELEAIDEKQERASRIVEFFNGRGAPLGEYADVFVEVADKYELDWRLLPAIATIESGGGKFNFKPFNAWGWGQVSFGSFEEGIETVGRGLKEGYLDRGLVEVEDIAVVYCPPNSVHWASSVRQFMEEL